MSVRDGWLLTCGMCLASINNEKAKAAGWLLLPQRQFCPLHREEGAKRETGYDEPRR